MTHTQKSRILLVDDHPIMRDGISQIINQQPGMEVCCEASSARDALKMLESSIPDLAVVDISLKDISGIELIKEMKVKFPDFPILVLSMHSESLYAERALKAGARGYIMKHEPADRLLEAIHRVLSGKIYLSTNISETILSRLVRKNTTDGQPPVDTLSDRELEVFKLIGLGLKPHQIAEKLFLSVKTIETYYSRLKQKFNLENALQLRQKAIQWQKMDNQG